MRVRVRERFFQQKAFNSIKINKLFKHWRATLKNCNYWLCHVWIDLGVVSKTGQSLATNHSQPHMVLITCSSSEIQLMHANRICIQPNFIHLFTYLSSFYLESKIAHLASASTFALFHLQCKYTCKEVPHSCLHIAYKDNNWCKVG